MNMKMLCLLLVFLVVLSSACRLQAGGRDPVSHETATRQARSRLAGEKFDPQESDPKLRAVFAAVDAEAERAVGNVARNQQFILRFWSIKKQLLRKKYGIDWRTPSELNPGIAYESYGQPRITQQEIREISPIIQRQFHHRHEKIVSFERTFEGEINVWTKFGETEDRGMYVVRRRNNSWKILKYHLVVP